MIAIIDYDAGNLTSVARAVSYLGVKCTVTNDITEIGAAERLIFPGVGAAGAAMNSLQRLQLDNAITNALNAGKPILGICLGTQVIMQHSEEGDQACLGILNGTVKAFAADMKTADGTKLKIPHMGWNRINVDIEHPVLSGLNREDEFYFVHSFYPSPDNAEQVIAKTDYGISFPSVIGYNNIIATQFHPEKSGKPGLKILNNFCHWEPAC